jgi:cyclophilin family peptidyl-prolyl cis-trans isomerase
MNELTIMHVFQVRILLFLIHDDANTGRHTNGSQFYITLAPASWMNTKDVAFG